VPGKSPHLGPWKTRHAEAGRNRRTVWRIPTANFKGAHFATFPPKLIEPCVLIGCPEGGLVLDPFAGSGTTGAVAIAHGRRFVGIELNPTYADMARERCEAARHDHPPQEGMPPLPRHEGRPLVRIRAPVLLPMLEAAGASSRIGGAVANQSFPRPSNPAARYAPGGTP
jgi:hypothetical protein